MAARWVVEAIASDRQWAEGLESDVCEAYGLLAHLVRRAGGTLDPIEEAHSLIMEQGEPYRVWCPNGVTYVLRRYGRPS